jgi:phage terminase large subunit
MYILKTYKEFINSNCRYQILYGGAGSGKSYVACQKLVLLAHEYDNLNILVLRKVASTLRNSVFENLLQIVRQEEDFTLLRINNTSMRIEFSNNSKIIFQGVDDSNKLKSIANIHVIFIEEADQLTYEDFKQINLRLRTEFACANQIIICFNPVTTDSWLFQHFFQKQQENTYIQKTTYLDNYKLPDSYRSTLESYKDIDINYYNIYVLGEWGSLDKLVFKPFKYLTLKTPPKRVFYGLDFGYVDPHCLIEVQVFDSQFYIRELIYQSGWTIDQLIDEMKALNIDKNAEIYADHSRPDFIYQIRQNNFNIKNANKEIKAGIDYIKMSNYNIFIDSNSINLCKELKHYSYKQKNGQYIDEIVDLNNHAIDAMRYALYSDYNVHANIYNNKSNTNSNVSVFVPTSRDRFEASSRLRRR